MDLNHTYDKIRYFRAKIIGLKGLGFALHGPIKSLAKMSINISFIISKELSDHTNHLKKKKKKSECIIVTLCMRVYTMFKEQIKYIKIFFFEQKYIKIL